MNSNGGAPYGSNEPTSFDLQPPQPGVPGPPPGAPQPAGVPYPGNPYAAPTQVVPEQQLPEQQVPQTQQMQQEPGTGRLIVGRYRLLGKLGHGGMGTVWRAKDETVDREVAVKEPRVPDHLPERERSNAFERMRREARAAARLDHPAVVNVHDVAVVDGQPWIVMELVQGRTLGAALQEGTLGVREAAKIGLDVLGALEAAHAAGILHRDVKPDNVLLGPHGRVVLTDFGIAQIEGETNLTDTGGFVGSPEFIAPERVLGQRPGPASDLWSLGVVLYAATEGISPFRRTNTPATLQSVLNATPAVANAAKGPLADAINALLNKDPARRPNAAQVRRLLEQAAQPPQETKVLERAAPGGKSVRIGRKGWIGIAAGLVVATAVTAFLQMGNPFAGPLPDDWKQRDLPKLGASVGVPADFVRDKPVDGSDGTVVSFSDPSGGVWISVDLDRKADDTNGEIPDSASAKAFADWATYEDGEYGSGMADTPAPKGDPKAATYKEKKAAENTVVYTNTDTQVPRLREARIFYYKAGNGDMYRLWIDYPAKGYFTDEGREIAKTAIASLDIDNL
ncbi:serine/threonine-protein kinase [Streptomyces flaveus]|uniref:non-specific serine/threonine protein kinase n=1 Tax=Streptomyces flaveus TaxID=66370 RepID=A0A917VF21_9ACTN|nr:serine/threonine-protein kinase [Streptomyces flaveus]GGK68201.1 protein kinase [Streptomyces flaveus]